MIFKNIHINIINFNSERKKYSTNNLLFDICHKELHEWKNGRSTAEAVEQWLNMECKDAINRVSAL